MAWHQIVIEIRLRLNSIFCIYYFIELKNAQQLASRGTTKTKTKTHNTKFLNEIWNEIIMKKIIAIQEKGRPLNEIQKNFIASYARLYIFIARHNSINSFLCCSQFLCYNFSLNSELLFNYANLRGSLEFTMTIFKCKKENQLNLSFPPVSPGTRVDWRRANWV